MDSLLIARLAHEHGQAVVGNDRSQIIADIVAELHPLIPQLAAVLPDPPHRCPSAFSTDVFDDYAERMTEYSAPAPTVTVKARWEDRSGGRPQIVAASPV
jgi:hypothetical protein